MASRKKKKTQPVGIYGNALEGTGLGDLLADVQSNSKLKNTEDIEDEIIMLRAIVIDAMRDIEFMEGDKVTGLKFWARSIVISAIKEIGVLSERHVIIKNSEKYNLTPEEVKELFMQFADIVDGNIKSAKEKKAVLTQIRSLLSVQQTNSQVQVKNALTSTSKR